MKKMYSLLFIAIACCIGNAVAQSTVTTQSQATKENQKQTGSISSDDHQGKKATQFGNKQFQKVSTDANSNSSVETSVTIKKVTITKEDWDSQSERGKEYILAHPELYILEK